jgi:hypothetical protein
VRHLRPLRLASFLLSALLVFGQSSGRDLNAERLQTGSFRYRTTMAGKDAGESLIQIRQPAESGNYVYSNRVEGAFSQSWEAIATRVFAPVSAKLVYGQGDSARTSFELTYRDGRVKGFAYSGRDQLPSSRRVVDEAVAADTVDQRIDWAAVMALPEYVTGGLYNFHVYDPGTGNSRITVEVRGFETIQVPAGSFSTARIAYRIEKNRGTEAYEVWVKSQSPRFLVKELFPNGAVTDLLQIQHLPPALP